MIKPDSVALNLGPLPAFSALGFGPVYLRHNLMSRTYIGPFGRILPVLENSDEDSSSTEGQEAPTQASQSNMTTYQLPPPQVPTRLEFGSDPRPGFSEPRHYDISSQSRRAVQQQRQSFDEPSVRIQPSMVNFLRSANS